MYLIVLLMVIEIFHSGLSIRNNINSNNQEQYLDIHNDSRQAEVEKDLEGGPAGR